MTVMAVFIPEELEGEILHDLNEEIFELYEASLLNLVELELNPSDIEMQKALFRSVHTIKGDLGLVGFTPMIEVLQYLEDILDMLRKSEIKYSTLLHDLVVRLLDTVSSFVDECVSKGKATYDKQAIDTTSAIIRQFTRSSYNEHEKLLTQAIAINSEACAEHTSGHANKSNSIPKTEIFKNISPAKQVDILFFRELMRPIEKRAGLLEGRGDKIATLAHYINALSETPIEPEQLAVACYTHDFGLAFMPSDLVNKNTELSAMEQNLLRSHVYKSTRLLEQLSAWDGARKIIMHHHERQDGSGFPLGISGNDICEGAKLLAIVETYINLTTANKSNATVMSEVDAVILLNKEYKQVFSGRWLRLFNQGMTSHLKQSRA